MSVYYACLESLALMRRRMARSMRCVAIVASACCYWESHAGTPDMVGRWGFDQASSPYTESTGNAADFLLDLSTTPATNNVGVLGDAAGTRWNDTPGISTRLAAYNAATDRDSFGFSVWIRPVNVAPYDNLFGKEMQATGGDNYLRLSWQVHVLDNDGSGSAPLEFVVRGSDRATKDFFGLVESTVKIPLYSNSVSWVHVAGGYDSATGELRLFVNGDESIVSGTPGADNSDGGALAIGTMKNGSDYIAYAAGADYDDFRFYDAPLSAVNAREILQDPESVPSGAPYVDGQVIAHWKLDEAGAPYADWSGYENDLEQDYATTTPTVESGVDGNALLLHWEEAPGVSTRLYASGNALQTDSFGFSFWFRPSYVAAGDNILAKEMPPATGEDFAKMAWQVKAGQDDGTGYAPIELVVRGVDRGERDFFGSVNSSVHLPLAAASLNWVHIAGGYDASTGDLCIYIDGVAATAAGIPGANNSDGSWFSVGSVRNGLDFVAYAATAAIDDIQLYNKPLSQYAVACLGSHAGEQLSFGFTAYDFDSDGSVNLDFQSIPGWDYTVEATTNLFDAFNPVLQLKATNDVSDVSFTPSEIETAVGAGTHQCSFFRVSALLPDASYRDLGLPAAEITPFLNASDYVPQYHFSWQYAAVGDPCGIIRYNNTYHAFTWDHGISDDLIHWQTQGWPFEFSIPNSSFWTGSVVVDKTNTSGFGSVQNPPMVTVFTIHNNVTGKEDIGIAYSTDYVNFYEYAGNPVISTADTTFRDPDVFWDDQMDRWVMVVARSEAKQLQFYYSTDLKNWTWMSDFGPDAGATDEIWEAPGLIQVPIRGMGGRKKWVLHVGGGSNKVQYWVGNFDGTTFTMDSATRSYLEDGTGLAGDVFAHFENDSYGAIGWTTTGDAFGTEPVPRSWSLPGQSHLGDRMASSYTSDLSDYRTGTLTSPEFTIIKTCINFLIGGGNHPGETCINLKINGSVVRTATGNDSDLLVWKGWNVAEYVGQQATIEIVDNYEGFWGRIYIDHITFSDVLFNTGREHANWVEYGPDFFAPRFIRDFDGLEQNVTWMGWVGNWDYETLRPQPVDWGKGAETLIRKLELLPTLRGYELTQQPVNDLQSLRGAEVRIPPTLIANCTNDLIAFQPTSNTYELEAEFNLDGTADVFGLNLCVDGADHKVVLGYDRSSSQLFLDRASSDTVLDASFAELSTAPYVPEGDTLKLRIFVDQSSIEVFTEDGCQVITAQIYPDSSSTGIELFSNGGDTTLRSARAWPLASIWPAP